MISCAQAFRFYDHLRDMDDMKDSRSELKAQDAMKSLRSYEKLKVVVGMNDSRS